MINNLKGHVIDSDAEASVSQGYHEYKDVWFW